MYLNGVKAHRQYPQNIHDWDEDMDNRPQMDGYPVTSTRIDLGYWRKHADLHGYVVNTFADGNLLCVCTKETIKSNTVLCEPSKYSFLI